MNRIQCGRCNRTVSDREMAMVDAKRLRSCSTLPDTGLNLNEVLNATPAAADLIHDLGDYR